MKALITSLFVASSLLPIYASAGDYDYSLVSDCLMSGDKQIALLKEIEELSPRLRGRLINDSEIAAIREAEDECAKKTPEEKAALKQKFDREFDEKYGVKMPQQSPQQPPANTGSFDHLFSPGGLFNPIHVKVH